MIISSNSEAVVEAIIEFSNEFSSNVTSSVTTVERMEKSYHEIKSALSSIPTDLEAATVVSHGLMKNMARRDLHRLLQGILRLEAILAQSVELLIMNGKAALSFTVPKEGLDHQQVKDVCHANQQISASLNLLSRLQDDMLRSIRSRH
ncbi:hypothetical protein GIV21_24995 [Pseudomonas syringae]|uniref:hypothetical protein n=1 Tax=Pseudomonas syringae group TaxID=136849 RepID=UPI000F03A31E|nr:hypothetical protein [Pseudomonas viridiflava]MCF9021378.1 hypothetical protein [Pseudomonas syringae]